MNSEVIKAFVGRAVVTDGDTAIDWYVYKDESLDIIFFDPTAGIWLNEPTLGTLEMFARGVFAKHIVQGDVTTTLVIFELPHEIMTKIQAGEYSAEGHGAVHYKDALAHLTEYSLLIELLKEFFKENLGLPVD